ncbi:transporter substrate-binding domain-containing protein [Microbulbifer sp. YPW1]|uniref:transporter substrate-binding domain-containing protein n=1 Tax=Microbulbifer sp. YPW1 TaxID=2745199 RepID=UPI00159A0522|nr:transporter substrate-binding domain-containing protein [Microbulbifer sp. YPW1]QKX17416.1 transporter substrate-binding domain-containing protein [Microbulbifer sp. YPW1]
MQQPASGQTNPKKGQADNPPKETGDAQNRDFETQDINITLLTDPGSSSLTPELAGEFPIDKIENYTETGDLDAIQRHGKLRILVDIGTIASLHRAATRQDLEIDQARRLAERLGLEPVVLYVNNFAQLIDYLNEGKGDIIANDLVITDERKKIIDFSIPVANTHLVLVSHKDAPDIDKNTDLKGKVLAVTRGTVYEARAHSFAKQHPGLEVKVVDTNYVDLAVEVSQKDFDFTILDDAPLSQVMQFLSDLKKNVIFPEERQIAWAIRKNSPLFMQAINEKIRHIKLTRTTQRSTGDLEEIKKRGILRAVTRNNPGSYFMWKGRVLGYEFELLEDFAKSQKLRLEVIVTPDHASFIQMLQDGKADIAANLLAPTQRRKDQGMAFSDATHSVKVGVVSRKEDDIKNLQDLSGRTIHLRKGSSHFDLFQRIQKRVPGVKLEQAPETMDIQEIFDQIAEKNYNHTFSDDITVNMERGWRDDIRFDLDLDDDHDHSWMVRKDNPELLKAINTFMASSKTVKRRKQLYTRYFNSPKPTRPEITKLTAKGEISPFDGLVQKYSQEYAFDWRLIVAQMFQESSFNPKAKSWVGARGLMQVMPDTGKQVGEKNLFNPENSVRAGIKYLEWLYRKFEDKGISPENMMWFTLASYNAGLGHVYDAQDLAEDKGWDRNVWFGNVENAMLLLSEKKYYRKARYGYARGKEPYDYVRKIESRYRTYVALLDAHQRKQGNDVTLASVLTLLFIGIIPRPLTPPARPWRFQENAARRKILRLLSRKPGD